MMKEIDNILSDIKKELELGEMYIKHKISEEDRDIDIVMSKADFNKINFPWNYKIVRRKLFFNNHIFVIRLDKKTKSLSLLDFHIDGLEYCNVFKISFNEIKSNSIILLEPNIYTLNTNYFYLDRYLGYMFFKSKRKRIADYFRNNNIPINFLSERLKMTSDKIKAPFVVKKKLIGNNFRKLILYKIFNIPRPRKKIKIVFIGVDGSGKSSTIVKLIEKIKGLKFSVEYNKCDIILLPLRSEGFGYCAVEAMACGKPVITTNYSALKEIVKDKKNGYLCEINNVDDFVKKIKMVKERLNNSENFLNNYDYVKNNFSLEIMARKYCRFYDKNSNNLTGKRIDKISQAYTNLL